MANINLDTKVFNKVYRPYLDNDTRFEVFYGGAGSGKSHFVMQRMVYKHLKHKKMNTLVVRKVAATNRLSTFPLFKQVISEWGLSKLFKINETEMRVVCKNGSELVFVGIDDPEKIKSVTFKNGILTNIWIEESSEVDEADFNQLNLRLRGKAPVPLQITLSLNPVSVNHWIKSRFFDRKVEDCITLKTTYKDNRFLDDAYKRELESYKTIDPYYYQVYALGNWGYLGQSVFNAEAVNNRLEEVEKTKYNKYSFVYDYQNEQFIDTSIRTIKDDKGFLTIFKEPEEHVPYVIGVDTAEGGYDYSVAHVINNLTGENVATYRAQIDTDILAKHMYCLGKIYNTALVAVEINFDLHCVKELQRLGYNKQFMREAMDKISKQRYQKYGFQTNRVTRPVIIDELKTIVRESAYLINDLETLNEMLTFVVNEKGRAEAMEGKHDDCILALAIAYKARGQQTMQKVLPKDMLSGTWTVGELEMKGYKRYEIRQMVRKGQIKLVGGKL